jgi:hypothetical protein
MVRAALDRLRKCVSEQLSRQILVFIGERRPVDGQPIPLVTLLILAARRG